MAQPREARRGGAKGRVAMGRGRRLAGRSVTCTLVALRECDAVVTALLGAEASAAGLAGRASAVLALDERGDARPAQSVDAVLLASAPDEAPASRPRRGPVLVVDDDAEIRSLVREVLMMEGAAVVEAADGREALAAVAATAPCLVLLDMRMPVMNGWEFAEAYRANTADCAPIVVMTAAQDAQRWGREVGADAVLAKPFDLDELEALVRRLLG